MSDLQLLTALRRIMGETGLTYSQLAVMARISPSTAREMFALDRAPRRYATREALVKFAAANGSARTRDEIRVAP